MAGADRMAIEEVVRKVLVDEHADVLRESVRWLVQQLMEVEVSELIGAEHGERRPQDRATHRNGYRARRWDTRAGEIELQIPKIRQGSYFPSFLQPRKRSEQALLSVVQQAYVCGVSTRRVDQLVESLGLRVSRSEVSRICAGLDEQVEAFRSRPLEGRYLYLFLDAKVEKVRDGGRVQRKCVVIAHGVHETGRREIIGLDVGAAETEAFWTDFLRALVARGLIGVQLIISDAHEGLKNAIAKVLGAPWQRCTVHFLRDCLGHARRDQHGLLAALIRPIFNADSLDQARDRLSEAVAALEAKLPKVATILETAEEDILAFYAFPADHWRKLRSTNPLERFNREIGRRTDVVGIFPDDRSLIRLASMLAIEQNDCHEGPARGGSVLPAPHTRRLLITVPTRGGPHAVSRHRLGHPPRELVRARRARRAAGGRDPRRPGRLGAAGVDA
jgi:putative transposase